jgi:choline dehydrogenase-like flavoprotein
VEYFEDDGTKKSIDAKLVILAAFAVQTPRILLNSANDRHPNGLANSSGRVGRYFTPHAAVNLYGMFSEETENHMGRTGGQLMCQDDYSPDPARGFVGGYTWRIGAALKLADLGGLANARLDLFGERLKTFMEKASKHLATMSALIANQPLSENCIALTGEKDKNGIPLARLTNTLGPDAKNAAQAAIKQGLEIFKAAGAGEAWAAPLRTEHMMGGTMMGEDPARSVTDGYGRTHDVENLFISGPGLMPTVGAVNPTFTASALAARTADHIIGNWADFGAS